VKTRSGFPYGRAEDDFSRFLAVRATTGLEIQAGVEPTRSSHTVSLNSAQSTVVLADLILLKQCKIWKLHFLNHQLPMERLKGNLHSRHAATCKPPKVQYDKSGPPLRGSKTALWPYVPRTAQQRPVARA